MNVIKITGILILILTIKILNNSYSKNLYKAPHFKNVYFSPSNKKDIQFIKHHLIKSGIIKKDNFEKLKILLINSGQTNKVYLIENLNNGKKYIFKKDKIKITKNVSMNYKSILKNAKIAGDLGISPKILYKSKKVIIREYTEGNILDLTKKFDKIWLIKSFLEKISFLHSYKGIFFNNRNPFDDMEYFFSKVTKKNIEYYEIIEIEKYKKELIEILDLLKKKIINKTKLKFITPCHNDIQDNNLVIYKKNNKYNLKLIDWDYSGLSDRFYDYALAISRFYLSPDELEYAINEYIKTLKKESEAISDDISDDINIYIKLMTPLTDYWCTLFHSFLISFTTDKNKIKYHLKRQKYYLEKFKKSYKKISNYINVNEIYSLKDLNKTIIDSRHMLEKININHQYISGGGAISILDNALKNRPIRLRDLDFIVDINKRLNKEILLSYAKLMTNEKQEIINVSNKIRSTLKKPYLPKNVGFQFLIKDKNSIFDYDYTFFNSQEDFLKNGIFSLGQIMIKIDRNEDLFSIIKKIRLKGYQVSKQEGIIWDPNNAYEKYLNHKVEIINWGNIKISPMKESFRVVKVYNKFKKLDIPKNVLIKLKAFLNSEPKYNTKRFYRELFKILGDKNSFKSLNYIQELGLFNIFEKDLSLTKDCIFNAIQKTDNQKIDLIILKQNERQLIALKKFESIIKNLNEEDKIKILRSFLNSHKEIIKYEKDELKELFIINIKKLNRKILKNIKNLLINQ